MAKETNIYSLDGSKVGTIKLPAQFEEDYRPDLIRRAVLSYQSHRRQAYAPNPMAGQRSSAKFVGRRRKYGHGYGYGISRVPRVKVRGGRAVGRAVIVPMAVGGRRTHPPKVIKNYSEKINSKERRKAICSAIAATAMKDLVIARGHQVDNLESLPLVVEDSFQNLSKTKEVLTTLSKLGLDLELARSQGKKIRAGKGTMRNRKYKKKKGLLVVVSEDKGIFKSARSIPGIDVVNVKSLNAELLAPGTHPGRVTLFTKSAIEALQKENCFR